MNQEDGYEQPQFPHTTFAWLGVLSVWFLFLVCSASLAQFLGVAEDDPQMAIFQATAQLAFMLVPTLALMSRSPLGYRQLLGLSSTRVHKRYWFAAAASFVLVQLFASGWMRLQELVLPSFVIQLFEQLEAAQEKMLDAIMGQSDLISILLSVAAVAVVPAFSEELLFRGLMQVSLEKGRGITVAIIHTSMFFALAHFSPQHLVPLLFISLILSILAQRSGSLLPGIALHMANNLLSIAIYRIPGWREADEATKPSIALAVLFVIGTSAIVFLSSRRLRAADPPQTQHSGY